MAWFHFVLPSMYFSFDGQLFEQTESICNEVAFVLRYSLTFLWSVLKILYWDQHLTETHYV